MPSFFLSVLCCWLSGWWFQPTPLKNMSESQLGWWNSQLFLESHKIPWFQTTNQNYISIYRYKPLSFYSVILTHIISWWHETFRQSWNKVNMGWSRIVRCQHEMQIGMLSNQHAGSQQSILQLVVEGPSTIWMNSEEFLEQNPNKNGHLPFCIY